MRFVQILSVGLLGGLLLPACAMERSAAKAAQRRPCVANYSTTGEFWAGKTFRSFQDFPTTTKSQAVEKVAATVVASGYQLITANRELGIVSASQTVSYGQGKTVPVNVVVKERSGGGIRVEIVVSLSGGLVTSADAVQDEFCKILESVSA